jgi:hypothetical protein
MSRIAAVTAAAVLAVGIAGCKKTVEGENKRWSASTQKVQELQALYPGFAAPLKEQLAKAQAVMDAAKGVSDQEAKIKKMAEANSLLTDGFVGQLDDVDAKKKRIREKMVTATTAATDKTDRLAAKQAGDDAQRVMTGVEEALKRGATEIAGANAIVRRAVDELAGAERNLDRVIDAARAKQRAAQKGAEPKGKGAKGASGGGGGAPAVTQWKCSYCDHTNATSAAKCTNCGAAKP